MNKKTVKILVPAGALGIPFDKNALINGIKQKPDLIAIDGGSTDKSFEIIKKYNEKIDKLVVEPDNGIWDAMNKGIKIASGDIVGFLNADDFYNPDALDLVNKYFVNNEIDFLFKTGPNSVFISTLFYNNNEKNWHYLHPDSGMHVFFYSKKSIKMIAKKQLKKLIE